MYLVAIAWSYVVLMMTVAEATSSNGTVLGAAVTLVLYGLLPVSLVMYLMGAPLRSRRRKVLEAKENADAALAAQTPEIPETPQASEIAPSSGLNAPDAGGEAPAAAAVTPVRKET